MKIKLSLIVASVFLVLQSFNVSAAGSHRVKGYTKKNGTRVASHYATNRNKSKSDNYSSKGNKNPHTGKKGTKNPNKR